jgi:hypothetical protein
MRRSVLGLTIVTVIVGIWAFAGRPNRVEIPAGIVPEFSVTTANGPVYYEPVGPSSDGYVVDDRHLHGSVTRQGDTRWTLTLTAKQSIRSVNFPWQSARRPLDSDASDDVFYYPLVLGIAEPARDRNVDGDWWGRLYPGEVFAPLVVMADLDRASIVAAANWPPKRAKPLFAAQRMTIEYPDAIAAGTTVTFGAIIATVSGADPWRQALDQYRSWLTEVAPRVTYPAWMWDGEGLLNVQLENLNRYSPEALPRPSATFPWVQFWGQMTTYGGGCCDLLPTMSARYADTLPPWTRRITAQGYHVGYYSAPNYNELPAYGLDTAAGVSWLTAWLQSNRKAGANAAYLDVIGRTAVGDPAVVRKLFAEGVLPSEALIEGVVDVYPVAGLVSGALVGDQTLCGAPYKPLQRRTTFPRFGRYLLQDRLIYAGGSNTDWRFWGENNWKNTAEGGLSRACDYERYCQTLGDLCSHGTERLAFLLGAKLDLLDGTQNAISDAVVKERQRVHWWHRRPIYRDTIGVDLSQLDPSSHIDVTRFDDSNGHPLLAVSNPKGLTGQHVTVEGRSVALPSGPIGIVDVEPSDR